MRAAHRFAEHTGEVALELEAPSPEGLFAEAAAALAELLGRGDGEPERRRVALAAADLPLLLADWLDELAYLAEVEGLVVERADVSLRPARVDPARARSGTTLEATVVGRPGSPAHLVKGATLHGLEAGPADRGWRARVVLDV